MSLDEETEERILEKATFVEEAVEVLVRKRSLSASEYRSNREQRAIVEREFQTAIEACIDIAELLLKARGVSMPETTLEKFHRLGGVGVLSGPTTERMKEAAGFRNVLAHQYGQDIDDAQVYLSLQEDLGWFTAYLREVREQLTVG